MRTAPIFLFVLLLLFFWAVFPLFRDPGSAHSVDERQPDGTGRGQHDREAWEIKIHLQVCGFNYYSVRVVDFFILINRACR